MLNPKGVFSRPTFLSHYIILLPNSSFFELLSFLCFYDVTFSWFSSCLFGYSLNFSSKIFFFRGPCHFLAILYILSLGVLNFSKDSGITNMLKLICTSCPDPSSKFQIFLQLITYYTSLLTFGTGNSPQQTL